MSDPKKSNRGELRASTDPDGLGEIEELDVASSIEEIDSIPEIQKDPG
ncbi:hypothetical protein H1S01_03685 [Heliobacterium chlorum]|uniref:Uncharacterized protein n=1 Tax=Heliobacterium chlorum TaxID=2698 RepID=A0ABR7T026_HELCL|nr:hypothetical protein [Heliobacterium chlorum]MBC9783615.1 hypothetical protein [Heliobacterium chlorum]